jgi:hypothetical protein
MWWENASLGCGDAAGNRLEMPNFLFSSSFERGIQFPILWRSG